MMLFKDWVQTLTPAQKDAWDLDEATEQMIEDRFYYREICDDERMVRYFQRTLDTVRDRYRDIIRIETIKFDPLVSKYFEGEFTTDSRNVGYKVNNGSDVLVRVNERHTDETHGEHTDNDLNVIKDSNHYEGNYQDDMDHENTGHDGREGNNVLSGTTRSQHSNTANSRTVGHSEDNTITDETTNGIGRSALKQAPMNASGVSLNGQTVGDISGMLTGLDFSYATSYNQNDTSGDKHSEVHDESENDTTTTGGDQGTSMDISNNTNVIHEGVDRHDEGEDHKHHEYEDDHSHDYQDARDITVDGEYHIDEGGGGTDTRTIKGSQEDSKDYMSSEHKRYTGRDDVLPQDALKAAMNYLQNYSTAFEWLCNKLEINFIGIYDI